MKICANCVLPDTFPGIVFDDEGICNYCQRHALVSRDKRQKYNSRYHETLTGILNQVKEAGAYNALMAYSGGKDSTFTLQYLVEELGLRVLALTFCHGFISEQAKENMTDVTSNLGVDHIYFHANSNTMYPAFKQSVEEEIYPVKALERASAICNTCMYIAKSVILKTAIEMQIKIIAYGWSPGQAPIQSSVMMLNASMVEKTQKMMREYLSMVMGEGLETYILGDRHFEILRQSAENDQGFYNVHPLAFLEYDEEKMLSSISKLGWKPPTDTDPNSSNCLLNTFANQAHLDRYKFHPYAMENASLVRNGHIGREEALERLNQPMDQTLSEYIMKTLKIT